MWIYSGFTFEELTGRTQPLSRGYGEDTMEMLRLTDVLVDGRFVYALKDITLRFRGSANQRLIDVPRTLAEGKVVPWDGAAHI